MAQNRSLPMEKENMFQGGGNHPETFYERKGILRDPCHGKRQVELPYFLGKTLLSKELQQQLVGEEGGDEE